MPHSGAGPGFLETLRAIIIISEHCVASGYVIEQFLNESCCRRQFVPTRLRIDPPPAEPSHRLSCS